MSKSYYQVRNIVLLYWLYVIAAGRSLSSLYFASRPFQNQSLLRQLE